MERIESAKCAMDLVRNIQTDLDKLRALIHAGCGKTQEAAKLEQKIEDAKAVRDVRKLSEYLNLEQPEESGVRVKVVNGNNPEDVKDFFKELLTIVKSAKRD